MLMVVRVDTGMDLSSPSMCIFVRVHDIGVQNSRKFQFELNVSIGME